MKVNVVTHIGKDFSNYGWTTEMALLLKKYNGLKTTRTAVQQLRISVFNLLEAI